MKIKYILAFVAVAAVIVFGAIKGWFKGKSASTQGTSSLILPSFGSSGGSGSSSSISVSGNTNTNTENNNNNNNTLVSRSNVLKQFAVLTGTSLIPLNSQLISPIAIETYSDNGYLRVKSFPVVWDLGYTNKTFVENGVNAWELGISGSNNTSDVKRNIEFIGGGSQEITQQLYDSFTSAIPFWGRMQSDAYVNDGNTPQFHTWSVEQVYDKGKEFAMSHKFGGGDNVNGKTRRFLIQLDLENGVENTDSDKMKAILRGMADGTLGFVCSMYTGCFGTFGDIYYQNTRAKKYNNYPNSSGNYDEPNDIHPLFKANVNIDLPNRGINNELFMSKRNILPCNEVSFLLKDVAPQGSNFVIDNQGNYVIINKFGPYTDPTKTADHPIARAKTLLEIQKWYAMNKLNNREVIMMVKVFCDRQDLGRTQWNQCSDGQLRPDWLESHVNQPMPRKYAFMLGLLVFMNQTIWALWNKAVDDVSGGYEPYLGVFALLKMLKTSGAFDLFYDMTPQLWDSEYSLDGTTWKKTKGIELDEAENDRLCVNTCTTNNKLIVSVLRPEGGEPTECWVRATVGGTVRTVHILPEYYETVSPEYGNTPLADIPTAHKHYYFNVFSY